MPRKVEKKIEPQSGAMIKAELLAWVEQWKKDVAALEASINNEALDMCGSPHGLFYLSLKVGRLRTASAGAAGWLSEQSGALG